MKDKSKTKDHRKQVVESSDFSLEEEIIKVLEKKNEQIKSGKEQPDQGGNKGKRTGGFDEWSVSWP